jgi:hypothetical protein
LLRRGFFGTRAIEVRPPASGVRQRHEIANPPQRRKIRY